MQYYPEKVKVYGDKYLRRKRDGVIVPYNDVLAVHPDFEDCPTPPIKKKRGK